jgi:malonyl-CoA/methylmalonyl-CoA synthetase
MSLTLVDRVREWPERIALDAPEGRFSYRDLLEGSAAAAAALLDGRADLDGARICFLVPPGWEYVRWQWGIWRAGGVAVPMAVSHPPAELAYVLDDAGPDTVVVHPDFADRLAELVREGGLRSISTGDAEWGGASSGPAAHGASGGPARENARTGTSSPSPLPDVPESRSAMMLYTSGTTGRPKGVVTTHANIRAQVESLVEAWGWRQEDHILLHLPLHHVHGIVNVLTCALWSGARCEILPAFDAREVWERLARGELTLYMAVPTIYRRLMEAWDAAEPAVRERWSEGAGACRLMVSGSAALPVPTLERWEEITGQRLLERYGMTEIGMALSNPLDGERRPGHVGRPLPGVELRLVDDEGTPVSPGEAGEIQVRGPGVFKAYWQRPEATVEAFTEEGWFRTGDRAVEEDGAFRILGRMSVDILKTGGEKVSALEIEDALRNHPGVRDVAVVGVPDPDWGERVCGAVVPSRPEAPPDPEDLRRFVKERLAPYKVPKEIRLLEDLPRNAMGKVMKPAVRELFEEG